MRMFCFLGLHKWHYFGLFDMRRECHRCRKHQRLVLTWDFVEVWV